MIDYKVYMLVYTNIFKYIYQTTILHDKNEIGPGSKLGEIINNCWNV